MPGRMDALTPNHYSKPLKAHGAQAMPSTRISVNSSPLSLAAQEEQTRLAEENEQAEQKRLADEREHAERLNFLEAQRLTAEESQKHLLAAQAEADALAAGEAPGIKWLPNHAPAAAAPDVTLVHASQASDIPNGQANPASQAAPEAAPGGRFRASKRTADEDTEELRDQADTDGVRDVGGQRRVSMQDDEGLGPCLDDHDEDLDEALAAQGPDTDHIADVGTAESVRAASNEEFANTLERIGYRPARPRFGTKTSAAPADTVAGSGASASTATPPAV